MDSRPASAPAIGRSPRSTGSTRFVASVAAIVALAGAMLLDLNGQVALTYDTFWHLFTARYDLWAPFFEAVQKHAHPPLYFLILKASAAVLGKSLLAYRAVSLLATLGSIAIVAHLVRRATGNPWLAPLTAAAFAFSWSTADVALEARGYSLAVFLSLAALVPFGTLAAEGFGGESSRATQRVLFATLVTLAFLVHYVAGFVFAACCAAPLLVAALDFDYARRLWAGASRRWLANGLTFGLPAAAIATSYEHIRGWSHGRLNHVPDFMFEPARESFAAFLMRTSSALADLFVPLDWTDAGAPAERVMALVVALVSAGLLVRAWHRGSLNVEAKTSTAILAVVWACIVVAARLGLYPYGGPLRHQYILLPLLLVVFSIAVDQLALPAEASSPRVRGLVAAVLAAVVTANFVGWRLGLEPTRGILGQKQLAAFRDELASSELVYLDQFGIVPYFAAHHGSDWSFEATVDPDGPVDLWRVASGGKVVRVCHDQGQWLADFRDLATYRRIATCLAAARAERVAAVRIQQLGLSPTWSVASTPELAEKLAPGFGLTPSNVRTRGDDVYAEFSRTVPTLR